MKTCYLVLLALALFASSIAPMVCASEFYEMIRELNAIQNQMALGDVAARDLSEKTLNDIERRLPSFSPATWSDSRNERAAAVYLLSGGAAKTLRRLFDEKVFPAEKGSLIEASLAYAEGHSREALRLLQKLNSKAYSPTLRAHLALVEGGLLIGIDNSKATDLLDLARLLMPRSLVEEAALRREIGIIDPLRRIEKLVLLGDRYAVNYFASPFAKQFWDELVIITIRASPRLDDAKRASIEALLERAPLSLKLDLYFGIIRDSLLHGRVELAASHAARARSIVRTSDEKNRLKLYFALVDILAGKFEQGAMHAQEVDPLMLFKDDLEVRNIIVSVAGELRKGSNDGDAKAAHSTKSTDQRVESSMTESSILKDGERSLASAGAMLKKATGK